MTISASSVRPSDPESESVFVTAPDGLRLHVRCWGSRRAAGLPVICLPGLSRTAADFDALAYALSQNPDRPRRVLALDYRGRGQSDYDKPANYDLAIELNDVMAVATALAAMPAVFVGSSRGGILTMLLAAARPTMIAGAILNDIGPVIEPKGLIRIKGYVGRLPEPRTFKEGAEILRRLFNSQFPRLTEEDWLAAARRGWREHHKGRLAPTYDTALARTLNNVDPERPLPPLWNQFDALAGVPAMVIRGANSDILSAETVAAMKARRQDIETVEVPDQGHTPLLAESDLIGQIATFIGRCDARLDPA